MTFYLGGETKSEKTSSGRIVVQIRCPTPGQLWDKKWDR